MLERRCRQASLLRNTVRRFRKVLDEVDAVSTMVELGYLLEVAKEVAVNKILQEIDALRVNMETSSGPERDTAKLDIAKRRLIAIRESDCRCTFLPGVKESEVEAYRGVSSKLVSISTSPRAAKDTIEKILAQGVRF